MFMGISGNRNVLKDVVQILRYRRMIATISALICLIFVSCGGSSVDDDTEPTASLLEGVEIVETPQETAVVEIEDAVSTSSGEPRRGGVFRTPSGNLLIPDPALFSPSSLFWERSTQASRS